VASDERGGDERRPGGSGAPPADGRAPIYLAPGLLHAAGAPTAITTVLGSCVAVCLHDPGAAVGGMNHYLLPWPVARERSTRFGNAAIEGLLEAVLRLGAHRSRLRAKVFGGAGLLGPPGAARGALGDENVRLAHHLLGELGIPVLDGDVGGERGRRLVFHTDTGDAWVRLI
jgi:chemotaxis protein CheD